jgi:Predicted ribosomal protein
MVKVSFLKKENKINQVIIKGHANFDVLGQDLVCAAVSSIAVGGINAIGEYFGRNSDKFKYDMNDGYINLEIYDINQNDIQVILETLYFQLKTIEESYSKYIKINI